MGDTPLRVSRQLYNGVNEKPLPLGSEAARGE